MAVSNVLNLDEGKFLRLTYKGKDRDVVPLSLRSHRELLRKHKIATAEEATDDQQTDSLIDMIQCYAKTESGEACFTKDELEDMAPYQINMVLEALGDLANPSKNPPSPPA